MCKMKYGIIDGKPRVTTDAPMYASTVLPAKSGRFIVYDTSATYYRAPATDEDAITAYVEQNLTCSATSGSDRLPAVTNLAELTFELPYATSGAAATLTAAVLETLKGKLVDIYVDGDGVQYANASASTDDMFVVQGGSVAENTLYVTVNPAKINQVS
jgi:hypothetical protein